MKKEQENVEALPEVGLRVIKGGKDGEDGGVDWLKALPFNTRFLAAPKFLPNGQESKSFVVLQFFAGGWNGKARVIVEENANTGEQNILDVDTKKFSNMMELFHAFDPLPVPDGDQEEEETETDNEQRDLPGPG